MAGWYMMDWERARAQRMVERMLQPAFMLVGREGVQSVSMFVVLLEVNWERPV